MLTKDLKATFRVKKDAAGKATGEVTAIVSAFGNVDVVGDRVMKGAFADSLEAWKAAGDPIPMLWSHDWNNPMSHIGGWDASKAVETDEGLELTGVVDIDNGNPIADQAYKLMSNRLVREFSFAYDVVSEKAGNDGANELLTLDIIEAGPTLKGANNATRLIAAKALEDAERLAAAKVGRAISAKNEAALTDAAAQAEGAAKAIKSVLKSLVEGGKSAAPERALRIAELEAELEALKAEGDAPADAPADPPADAPEDEPSGPVTVDPELLSALEDAELELVLGLSAGDVEPTDEEPTPAPEDDAPATI